MEINDNILSETPKVCGPIVGTSNSTDNLGHCIGSGFVSSG